MTMGFGVWGITIAVVLGFVFVYLGVKFLKKLVSSPPPFVDTHSGDKASDGLKQSDDEDDVATLLKTSGEHLLYFG